MGPITLYHSDRLRVRLAAFLDISRTALRAAAPIVDLLVRLSLAKAFFAPGMLPGGAEVNTAPGQSKTAPERAQHPAQQARAAASWLWAFIVKNRAQDPVP